MVVVVLFAGIAPSVMALDDYTEYVEHIIISADSEVYNQSFNWSDPDSSALLNYNMSVVPFLNQTNVTGIFTGPYMPPSL